MLRTSLIRAAGASTRVLPSSSSSLAPRFIAPITQAEPCRRYAHAISNPTLANIEQRWEAMPPQDQADLWMQLRDRMKVDWKELTLQEKRAAYWIAFGPHGPRSEAPPGENWTVIQYTLLAIVASAVLFGATRLVAKPPPHTMTKEWQEQSNEYMKENRIEPLTGISSEGYKGKGVVQSN
ncbi:COX4-domain-containing protein [Eremomyces bilateralis CBS 781.70]|uniref:Cytochrome c oxidase polypeptide V n=1 Tax=Eremomyces bilateralis CBS 781.70 TaxID=1392243 RepID=A0A6G1FX82_9PEZI|nr:COX4-domain-containing protein [Eremomyces bilateralis CBS 781.70]KAF1810229.1 COX4-domain-containing protein [Eremomyces bilateralis CBS 781.70]